MLTNERQPNSMSKMKMMLVAWLLALPPALAAQTKNVFYMNTVTSAGKVYVNKLDGSVKLPLMKTEDRTLLLGAEQLSFDDVEYIRFEMKTEDISGIVDAKTDMQQTDVVYTLGGQRVNGLQGVALAKGIYIVGRKKMIVK